MNTAIRLKIDKAKQKLPEIDEKIKSLQQEKRDLIKQIKQLEDEEFYTFCKGLDVSMEELNSDVEIGKVIRNSGLTKEDIESLISIREETENE